MAAVADRPLVVGNCSGFYGDRLSALRELLEGSPRLDVITGDYLAELTMLILAKDTFKDPEAGYARTFVRQIEDCLALAIDKGVRIVTNAGGLNPAGLANRIRVIAPGKSPLGRRSSPSTCATVASMPCSRATARIRFARPAGLRPPAFVTIRTPFSTARARQSST